MGTEEKFDARLNFSFGKLLKQWRLARGFSQEELAFNSEIHRTFVSQLERGLKNPSLATLFALATALNMKPSDMLCQIEHEFEKNLM